MGIGIKVAVILLGASFNAYCDQGWERAHVSLIWENDAIGGTDRHYTQGGQLSYYSHDDELPAWLDKLAHALPHLGFEQEAAKWGVNAGQEIYTPTDLATTQLEELDRPYAGWVFAGLKLQRRGPSSLGGRLIETLRAEAGVVGPAAMGRETQALAHHSDPQGWRHQLHHEPGIILLYDRRYLCRTSFGGKWNADLIPRFEMAVGNVLTYGALGTTARLGVNVPNEFERAGPETTWKFGGYLFLGAEGRLVGHNIFLDGNTFHDSHQVDKKQLVGDLKIGLTVVLKRFEITFSQTLRTREFERQEHNDSFATVTLLMKF